MKAKRDLGDEAQEVSEGVNKSEAVVSERRKSARNANKRPKLSAAETAANMSSSLYLGYVEDNEGIDAIMKKFEKLEKLKQKKAELLSEKNNGNETVVHNDKSETEASNKVIEGDNENENGLTEKEMEDLFKQTSSFKLEKILREQDDQYFFDDFDEDTDGLIDDDEDEEEGWDMEGVTTRVDPNTGIKYYIVDDDEEFTEEDFIKLKKSKRGRKARVGVKKIGSAIARLKMDEVEVVALPSDDMLPESWGKQIRQYVPRENINTKTTWKFGEITNEEIENVKEKPAESKLVIAHDIFGAEVDLFSLAKSKINGFEGIVISPPWKERFITVSESDYKTAGIRPIDPEDLLKLKLGDKKILKAGFIYIWVPKHLLVRVVEVMKQMNFYYVENAASVRLHSSNRVASHVEGKATVEHVRAYNGKFMCQAHETCYIFRRGYITKSGKREWERVEIRHQRTSDVKYTFYQESYLKGVEAYYDNYMYNLVETMVPLGRYNPEADKPEEKQEGRLLHLWGPPAQRTGWTTICCKN